MTQLHEPIIHTVEYIKINRKPYQTVLHTTEDLRWSPPHIRDLLINPTFQSLTIQTTDTITTFKVASLEVDRHAAIDTEE